MAMTNAEKQAAWRARRDQYVKDLEQQYIRETGRQADELVRQRRHIEKLEHRIAELEAATPERVAKLEAEVKRLHEQLRNYILNMPEATLANVVADRAAAKRRRKGPKDIPPTVGITR
jgi:hypothetical protein